MCMCACVRVNIYMHTRTHTQRDVYLTFLWIRLSFMLYHIQQDQYDGTGQSLQDIQRYQL